MPHDHPLDFLQSSMKVLLIHPPFLTRQGVLREIKSPPLGLATLTAVLDRQGYDTLLYDANVYAHPPEQVVREVTAAAPDVIGITATTLLYSSALTIARQIKAVLPAVPIVFGGVHASACPEAVIDQACVDVVVFGEGEITFPELLVAIRDRRSLAGIPGVGVRENGNPVLGPPRELVANLDDIPIPAYAKTPLARYGHLASTEKPFCTMLTSRGCPYSCIFCGVHAVFGRRYRAQSPERSAAELGYLIGKLGVREVQFKDSEFIISRDRVRRLCELILTRNLRFVWSCNARVDLVDGELLRLMRRAGCRAVTYGAESGCQRVLDALRKEQGVADIVRAVALAKEAGLETVLNFIVGNPGESRDEVLQTLELAARLDPDYCMFSNLTPFPGSPLWEIARCEGWLRGESPDGIDYEQVTMNATAMPDAELAGLLNEVYRRFYFRPSYVWKRLRRTSLSDLKNSLAGGYYLLRKLG